MYNKVNKVITKSIYLIIQKGIIQGRVLTTFLMLHMGACTNHVDKRGGGGLLR